MFENESVEGLQRLTAAPIFANCNVDRRRNLKANLEKYRGLTKAICYIAAPQSERACMLSSEDTRLKKEIARKQFG